MRFNSEAERAAYDAWNHALLAQAEHEIDCREGCTVMGDVCPTGLANGAAQRQRWQEYHDIRQVTETVQLAGVVEHMDGSGL